MVSKKQKKVRLTVAKQQRKKSEMTRLGAALRSLGGLGGSFMGGMVGHPGAGASLGTGLGAQLSRWLGSGDYNVKTNSLVSSVKASGNIPAMHKSDQTITVRHKEFVCEVVSATTYTVQRSFDLNPGLPNSFPWLCRLANSYQQYRIKGMVFHYVPTSGSAVSSTNNALGSVMLQTSYRSTDDAPSSKVELLNEYWSCESVPSEAFVHPIECNPEENPFNIQYVRGGPVPAGDNQLLYDLGRTHLAVSGQQAAGITLGDLWVTYEVELKKPIIQSNVTTDSSLYTAYSRTAPASFSNIWGPTPIPTIIGNVQLSLTGNVITIPVGVFGTFSISVWLQASSTFTSPCTFSGAVTLSNCTGYTVDGSYSQWSTLTTGAGTLNGGQVTFAVQKSNRDVVATMTLPTYTTSGGTLNRVDMFVWGSPEV